MTTQTKKDCPVCSKTNTWMRYARARNGALTCHWCARRVKAPVRMVGATAVALALLMGLTVSAQAADPIEKTSVCVAAVETKDASGFAIPHANKNQSLMEKVEQEISKRKGLALVTSGCTIQVSWGGTKFEQTGETTVLRQNPLNPYAVTGTRAVGTASVSIDVKVGEYTTTLTVERDPRLIGSDKATAGRVAKALEKWVIENAEAIKAQVSK